MAPTRIIAGLLLLAGLCTPAQAAAVRYACTGGTKLTATFSPPSASPGSVALAFAGASRSVTLPQAMSADGGRYADGTMEFWIKGRDATLTRGEVSETCHAG